MPHSLSELLAASTTVVECVVESNLPSRQQAPRTHMETDTIVSVSQVLKGDLGLRRLMISELGGTIGPARQVVENDTLMRPGEKYVLFLTPDSRQELPYIGLSRFAIVSLWNGKARIIGQSVTINSISPLKNVYDGVSLEQFKGEILAGQRR